MQGKELLRPTDHQSHGGYSGALLRNIEQKDAILQWVQELSQYKQCGITMWEGTGHLWGNLLAIPAYIYEVLQDKYLVFSQFSLWQLGTAWWFLRVWESFFSVMVFCCLSMNFVTAEKILPWGSVDLALREMGRPVAAYLKIFLFLDGLSTDPALPENSLSKICYLYG